LLKSEVQKVALAPARSRRGHLLILTATENFDVGIIIKTIRVRAPTGLPLPCLIAHKRQHSNRGIGHWRLKRRGRLPHNHGVGIDQKRLLKDDVIA
jgi:hypothetical protein